MQSRGNNYISAFTIIEAVVAMAVTAIILCIIFIIFSITSERLLDFKKQNGSVTDLNRMCYSLNKAIFESEKMDLVNEGELYFTVPYGEDIKYYISKDRFVMDRNGFTDTFYIATKRIHSEMLPGKSGGEYYQRLRWVIVSDKREIPLNFYKKIYPDELLNQRKDEH
ncbi:hypothetical protein AAEO56_11660 [Flavobacterium sp. DGU11]|uniref:Prepilin-type N-terminal cleavage/methylation domain-containing protein n=1 Tax=Flavobacterium arundinis TaxID=3139143 RepID=A0ABU9HXM7_9FLAO